MSEERAVVNADTAQDRSAVVAGHHLRASVSFLHSQMLVYACYRQYQMSRIHLVVAEAYALPVILQLYQSSICSVFSVPFIYLRSEWYSSRSSHRSSCYIPRPRIQFALRVQ